MPLGSYESFVDCVAQIQVFKGGPVAYVVGERLSGVKGGPGSGNFGHGGRPGEVGGSGEGTGGTGPKPVKGDLKAELDSETAFADKLDANNFLTENLEGSSPWECELDDINKAKDSVVRDLAERLRGNPAWEDFVSTSQFMDPIEERYTDASERWADTLVQNWAGTSGDNDPLAVALQQAAQAEFGLPDPSTGHFSDLAVDLAEKRWGEAQPALQSFMRAQYEATQEALSNAGITEIQLYRGMGTQTTEDLAGMLGMSESALASNALGGGVKSVALQPLSSFSSDPLTAFGFTKGHDRVLVSVRVPASRILSSARTGAGCLGESEFVVLGSQPEKMLLFYESSKLPRGQSLWGRLASDASGAEKEILGLFQNISDQAAEVASGVKSKRVELPEVSFIQFNKRALNADADLNNADWTKEKWDLGHFSSVEEFRAYLEARGITVAQFKKLPVFQMNREKFDWLSGLESGETTKGGEGSGNWGHGGRPGEVGGSGEGAGGLGGMLTQSSKVMAKAYSENPRFRALADGVALYTQGSYQPVREASAAVVSGEPVADDTVGDSTHPLGAYTAMVEGQDLENSQVPIREAATEIQRAVASSPPLDQPMYRGFDVMETTVYDYETGVVVDRSYVPPEVGSTMDVQGVSSFTTDRSIAEKFSMRAASGQRRRGGDLPRQCVIIEVEPGARALNVQKLSPWRQKEVLSSGRFEVLSVEDGPGWLGVGDREKKIDRITRVKLKQISVWDVGG